MKAHPIIESPFRWIPMLVLALILVVFQVALVCGYTGNDYLPALVDGIVTIGWLAAIAYLAWFVVGLVSLFQTDVIMIIVGSLLWLAGSFMIYIQACGDYVMLITPTGEYLKEQTMKYFETHLSPDTFVRVHRSTIVNVTQISRVELFGKETYQLLLKNGVKLRVSLSGYRLLKERLGI